MSKTGNHREDAPETGDYLVTLCAFLSVGKLDKAGQIQYLGRLESVPSVRGLACNGHIGETNLSDMAKESASPS